MKPFRAEYPLNPSWEIAKTLPEYLPAPSPKEVPTRRSVDLPPVRILVHPEPIRVNWNEVRKVVPSFWQDEYMGHKIDIVIHIGMAGPRHQWVIERRGHRTGYKTLDGEGNILQDQLPGMQERDDWVWKDMPEEIQTDLDLQDILMRWQSRSPLELELRISEDAGHFLCDFIYYNSLSLLLKQQRKRNVVFFHVPCDQDEKVIQQSRELAINLIRSVVESQVSRRD